MHLAIVTKSASTKSGAKVPFDLAPYLAKQMQVTVFAAKHGVQKDLFKILAKDKIDLVLYSNPFDLYQKLKKANCQVISSHATFFYLLSSKLTGIPIVKTYHGTQFDAYLEKFVPQTRLSFIDNLINTFFNKLLWLDQKIQLVLSDQVISISIACQKELKDLYKTKSKLIYNGINLIDRSKPTSHGLKPKNAPILILSVSRITSYKGFHLLIGCVKKIRDQGYNIKLTITGTGEKKSYLSYLKRKLDKNDQILTSLNDKDLAKLYKNCDIYATCDRYLFFGLPIAEAASFAKPAIALDSFAAKELIINGRTGYVAKNMDQFSKFLKLLLSNQKRRAQFGTAALKHVQEKFDIENTSKKYISVLEKIAV
ncbi:MAG: glycosyltransferase family 4 protein [Candidatus Curtissbacteria bacterium]|nr:glycosyltransferase family 4 protein [Candidatus Curtissbacteria bacterium]